nr:DUF1508 domain-containing protein [Lysobacter chinensis]
MILGSTGKPWRGSGVESDHGGYWRWTLYAANNRKIADSGESYYNRSGAEAGIDLVKSTHYATPVRE